MRRAKAVPEQVATSAGPRRLEREWLDELPAGDPRALRSRRDLRRVQSWMGQVGIMRRLLAAHCGREPPRTILELGGGDGTFMLRVARRMGSGRPGPTVTLVDRHDAVDDRTRAAFLALHWNLEVVTADVFDFLRAAGRRPTQCVVANLFLHHFDDAQLERLFAYAAPLCSLFVAAEPRRSAIALSASRLLWAIGCNDVSRHDAVLSVRAGFAGTELSRLWPNVRGWALDEGRAGPFTHCFAARRTDASDAL